MYVYWKAHILSFVNLLSNSGKQHWSYLQKYRVTGMERWQMHLNLEGMFMKIRVHPEYKQILGRYSCTVLNIHVVPNNCSK